MGSQYILNGHTPVIADDLLDWGHWFQTADRRVARTQVGECDISTVFLGFDHQFGQGPPLLFETLVFGGPLADEMDRYSTWEEAEAGHADMVRRAEEANAAK